MYGYGYFNSFKTLGNVSFDPDAQAFITAASITDPTQQSAVNQLVVDLKAASLWTKMLAVYPMVGSSASSHSYNLRNTAQYQISWSGGLTHNSNGVTFGGINGFGNTGFNPNTGWSNNDSAHLSLYCRTNNSAASIVDSGCTNGSGRFTALNTAFAGNGVSFLHNSSAGVNPAVADTRGFFVGTRTASNVHKMFRNNLQLGSTDTGAAGTRPNFDFYIGALNSIGTPNLYTNRNIAFTSIGDGLSDTEAADLTTAVQAFQTTLGRQV